MGWQGKPPSKAKWLSPADYRALSAAEKGRLRNERLYAERRERARRTAALGRRGGGLDVPYWRLLILGSVFTGIVAWQATPVVAPAASATSAVRADFGFCHSGGGINCVVDGDTFYIGGAKVRIAGIDTPETHPPRCADEARLGNQATDTLHALLNSGAVTMTSIDRDRDTYGRLLRNVQVDGDDVGAAMVSAGVAREYGSGRRGWC